MDHLAAVIEGYQVSLVSYVPGVVGALLIFLAFWIVSRWVVRRTTKALAKTRTDSHMDHLLARLIGYGILVLGIVTALGTLGVNLTALVATLGLAGFAISFAFQDIVGNLLAGLLIMLQRPFKIGDAVSIGGTDGTVEDIRMRDTSIKTYDGHQAIIPNKAILSGTLINLSTYAVRRFTIVVRIGYDADIRKALDICRQVVAETEGILKEPNAQVVATAFGESSIELNVRFWVDTKAHSVLLVRSQLIEKITVRFDEAEISIPVPIRTMYLEGKA